MLMVSSHLSLISDSLFLSIKKTLKKQSLYYYCQIVSLSIPKEAQALESLCRAIGHQVIGGQLPCF